MCAVCMLFLHAGFISFAHSHRLQSGTKFTFKFNLRHNEKARKSWKRKLARAINMNLTARFFWFIHQMWVRGMCSLTQLLKPWPWRQGAVNHRNSSWDSPEWSLAASCRRTDTLSNNALKGTGPLSLIIVAVPGNFQQHSGNYPKFISNSKFRIKGTRGNDRVFRGKAYIFFKNKKYFTTHIVFTSLLERKWPVRYSLNTSVGPTELHMW